MCVLACQAGPQAPGDIFTMPTYYKLGITIRLNGFDSFKTLKKDLNDWGFPPTLKDQEVFDTPEFRSGYAEYCTKIWDLLESWNEDRIQQVTHACGGYVPVRYFNFFFNPPPLRSVLFINLDFILGNL